MSTTLPDVDTSPPSPEVVARLVDGHREFLAFLRGRVGDPRIAEELLQAAFVKTLEKGGSIQDGESAVAWFYRLLRNALTDHYRSRASEARALEHEARVADTVTEQALEGAICTCMNTLLPTLKPEYADMLQRVDLQGASVTNVASELGISANNATVRLHRARQALKKQLEKSCGTCATHGCLDCSCGSSSSCGG